jgi:hypothetical protein
MRALLRKLGGCLAHSPDTPQKRESLSFVVLTEEQGVKICVFGAGAIGGYMAAQLALLGSRCR